MASHKVTALATTTAMVVAAAVVGSLASEPDSLYYASLSKPSWNPPNAVFPVAWTALYADIAVVTGLTLAELRERARQEAGGRVIAVGTTSLRLLETASLKTGRLDAFVGETDIFITPGYRFRAVDVLMTNFHLPKSTLFMLVSALMGLERMQAAYAHAIAQGYRFYSLGDAMLLERLTSA